MRICFFGLEDSIHVERLVRWFAGRGHEVHLISRGPAAMKNVTVHDASFGTDSRTRLLRYLSLSFNIYSWNEVRRFFLTGALLQRIAPDICHIYSLLHRYPAYVPLLIKFHPLVVSPLDGDITWAFRDSLAQRWLVRLAARRGDVLTGGSEFMLESWRRWGAPEDKLRLVNDGGVDLATFFPASRDNGIRVELGLGDATVVLSTRSLAPFYNIDVLVRAIPTVLRGVPEAKFVFIWNAGTEEEIAGLTALVRQLGVEDAVRFVGRVRDYAGRMVKFFQMADVFVSLAARDTSPASLLEAMACGVPPVCADVPGVTEWIRDGENGLIVPLGDPDATGEAIVSLLTDSSRGRLFAGRNLGLVRERADFEVQMRKVEQIYHELLERRRP